ncbi:hypothetical protein L226DRAFT_574100 [Lentinus tigrinus ALCF2SS1-7]|uniref:Uncharacterized protein n=1 Tax=Lentinus tigrinus ALCF2SS1-6 TaxID=1328759 RepID=A0A5C2RW79_9APHY|nr:hypothetical protein L227DRAFT_615451 [Lentinus tigrinus ALCF2SS1-6]RPD71353.1 hypothetical protein L226DRAFT_574100 [Lentinus tigrinus ALCF2SS1-7]
MSTNSRDYASYLMHSRISRIFQLLGFNRLYTVTPPETRQRTTLDAIPEDPPPLVREYPPSRQVIVPQALYSRYAGDLAHRRDELSSQNSEYLARVPFALKNPVPGYHGIPMALLIQGRGEAFGSYVHAGEEPVLTELVSRGIMEIQLEVRWPAYPNWVFRRKIPIADIVTRKPFTRLVLACNLANVFKLFTMVSAHSQAHASASVAHQKHNRKPNIRESR